jgi:hypothetical protein
MYHNLLRPIIDRSTLQCRTTINIMFSDLAVIKASWYSMCTISSSDRELAKVNLLVHDDFRSLVVITVNC